jgi:DNA-binding transcriptional MerR regulator
MYPRLFTAWTIPLSSNLVHDKTSAQSSRYSQWFRVGEAAREVGVRVSALHFWEQQGLLHPSRNWSSRYRLYDEQQMYRLRVVVLLREARYDFNVIRSVLDELAADQPEQAIVAVEKRPEELTWASWLCIEALTCFQRYVSEFCGGDSVNGPRPILTAYPRMAI